jgi:zinc transport system substrate-binding protein
MLSRLALVAALCATSGTALAQGLRVAADIAPIQSLVAQVMGPLGTPDLILPPGASPHGHAMRPSQARSLARADVVFWTGDDLSPWLHGPLETLAGKARVVDLSTVPGVTLLELREGAAFGAHDHGDHDADGAAQGDDDHPDHETHAVGHDEADHADHGHDPHSWLDPENAKVWLQAMAETLGTADPGNAAAYEANATAAAARISALTDQISADLAPLADLRFVVFHDAYQYFEHRFGLTATAAISLSDASDPSASRVAEVRRAVSELDVTCVAAEPQFNPALVRTVAEGSAVTATVLDPVGADLAPGPELYGTLLRQMADGFLTCR